MSNDIRLCLVGAGSSYTPEIVTGILEHSPDELPVTSLQMYDINEERLNVMGGLAERMVKHQNREIKISYGTDIAEMMSGVNFVITQMRVGGMDARYLDESIPLKYGVIGQETTGPGGMFKALRTIPPMIEIANATVKYAPDAHILNYTNPSGIIAEAVARHSEAKLIGLCSGMPGIEDQARARLEPYFEDLDMYCVGLNHLGFMHKFVSKGEDVTDRAIQIICSKDESTGDNGDISDTKLIRLLRAIPIGYVNYFFRERKRLEAARSKDKTRAQEIMEIEKSIHEEAADPETVAKPTALVKRGGGGYSHITFKVLKAIMNDTGEHLPCTIQNRGAVNGIEDDAGVEIMARIDANGASPIPVGDIPLAFRGIVQSVKAYETLTIQAAVEKRRDLAIEALLNNPLCGDIDVIEPMVDEMLAAHKLDFR